mmetsp:Transcript_36299/g.58113  ORF Transcript_36299/g.58113 Transcript_36299/m.58113 type:complete len:115 (-) Transcript_36299:385-729(-)
MYICICFHFLSLNFEIRRRMAHLEGVLNGFVALVFASLMSVLRLSPKELTSLSTCLMINGYGNTLASIFGAIDGSRGFTFAGSLLNRLSNLGFLSAMAAIPYASYLVIKGVKEE